MKNLAFLLILLFGVECYCQTPTTPLLSDTFPFSSNYHLLEVYREEYGDSRLPIDSIPSFENLHKISEVQLSAIFDEDPESFWLFDNQYITPLQMKLYKQTKDYQTHIDSLRTYRENSKHAIFYMGISSNQTDPLLYDLRKHGFEIRISDERDWMKMTNQEMLLKNKMLALFNISKLKTYIGKSRDRVMSGEFCNYLFIPVDEESGAAIEKLGINCVIYFAFDFASYSPIPCQLGTDGYSATYYNGRLSPFPASRTMNGILPTLIPKTITTLFIDTQKNKVLYSKSY